MDIARHLVDVLGVDIGAQGKRNASHHGNYQSAVHELTSGRHWWHVAEALPDLIKKGAYLEVRDSNGRTPLHLSCGSFRVEVQFCREAAKVLIENGADINAIDDHSCTFLSMVGDDVLLVKKLIVNGSNVNAAAVFRATKLMQVEILELLLFQDDVCL
ncbi:hypothetical protein N7495_002063 [Penicillium taxi]|uniref:uncharacterized protein n=1 Tax=Penicillium taxi TaxID=168475 RepID=UPI002544E8FF|nr:uncharacterized protein N7495_002063 [Penicillium taxi]KAJ5901535.1 hypothetical protein N7495_002063 [Penicillium taxi]